MRRNNITWIFIVTYTFILVGTSLLHANTGNDSNGGALAGRIFKNMDFTEPYEEVDIIPSMDVVWDLDRGMGWSAQWYGKLNGPYFGDVTFSVETNGKVRLVLSSFVIINTLTEDGPLTGTVRMSKDGGDWILLEYVATEESPYLRIFWEWPGKPKTIIPNTELGFNINNIPGYGSKEKQVYDDYYDQISPMLPRFTGGQPVILNHEYHDGRARPIVGVHNFQVFRANRTNPDWVVKDIPYYPENGFTDTGFMYNHGPHLAYWIDLFWLSYRSGPTHEHEEPCYNLITWSKDGRNWEKPETIFPAKRFHNRSKNNQLQYSIAHQRMAFYVTEGGRLLVSGYYGMPPSPNNGRGIGRVVREVYGPGNYGPIYWVRYNSFQGYSEDNSPHFPFYKEAEDNGFIDAVDELLSNNLMMQQWYEEERFDDGRNVALYPTDFYEEFDAKAFCWYTLDDGRIVGLWKGRWMALADNWEKGSIKVVGKGDNIYYLGAKAWGQRTADGRYAIVYNPVLEGRNPLSVITSDDGLNFDTYFLNAHTEAPPMRVPGHSKDGGGSGYVRGIIPGNGTPPDSDMWLTYSSNKEDIWFTRVPVPITGIVDSHVDDDFEYMVPGGNVTNWNIYSGVWTSINIVDEDGKNILRLEDKDLYEYAKAVRVFPKSNLINISFKLRPYQIGDSTFEIEVLNYKGQRPVRIIMDPKSGSIKANVGLEINDVASFKTGEWVEFEIDVDTYNAVYSLRLNGDKVISNGPFAEALDFFDIVYPTEFSAGSASVERIEFRTGAYRMTDFSRYGSGQTGYQKGAGDLPNADFPVKKSIFDINDFRTSGPKINQMR